MDNPKQKSVLERDDTPELEHKEKELQKEIPYGLLKENGRAYEIMLLRDQSGDTFCGIAKKVGLSARTVRNAYYKIKFLQSQLYINHISIVLGVDRSQIKAVYAQAVACYQDEQYACAYLEQEYHDILTAYRNGEPGMPQQFLERMTPFQHKLSKDTVDRIIEMRDAENASFVTIAKALGITQQKAKDVYDRYYYSLMLKLMSELESKVDGDNGEWEIWEYCLKENYSPKKRYDTLKKWSLVFFP